MLVGEILAKTSEHTYVDLIDAASGSMLASYDGRDSIPTAYDKREVQIVYVEEDVLVIEI